MEKDVVRDQVITFRYSAVMPGSFLQPVGERGRSDQFEWSLTFMFSAEQAVSCNGNWGKHKGNKNSQ